MLGDGPHKASNVYAFAITSHQIWTKTQSFQDHRLDMEEFLQEVMQRGARPEYPDPTPLGTKSIWKIFEECWRQDPHKRLDMESAVQKISSISLPRQRILSTCQNRVSSMGTRCL
ncbi:hypothetical protein P691DRAFT_243422 [Macrolepiota fuliginosa MF-IS2]|uniref:Serine-threonine/tyrosine-protein kinase catalytic domain-containing protein n=1 Tax=Macrolepiota fuliginosa MF-IS2 TaxID=1400762 RepID=A0A9P6C202_9AGAR|nr:hypothetical protein P691DRAFT_243422 [Macrolepiota fuliginosa MF-IS2]